MVSRCSPVVDEKIGVCSAQLGWKRGFSGQLPSMDRSLWDRHDLARLIPLRASKGHCGGTVTKLYLEDRPKAIGGLPMFL